MSFLRLVFSARVLTPCHGKATPLRCVLKPQPCVMCGDVAGKARRASSPRAAPPITAPGVSPSPRSQHIMHSSSGHPAVQQGGLRCWPWRGCSSVKSASPRLVGACNCLIARLTLTAVPNLLGCHLQARFPLQ